MKPIVMAMLFTKWKHALQLGELELGADKADAARARLKQLEKDARSKGYLLIARKALASGFLIYSRRLGNPDSGYVSQPLSLPSRDCARITGKQEGTEYFSFADRRPEWEQLLARMHREDSVISTAHMERACDIPAMSWMGYRRRGKAYNLSSLSESRKELLNRTHRGPDGQIQLASLRESLHRPITGIFKRTCTRRSVVKLLARIWTKQLAHLRRAGQVSGVARAFSREVPAGYSRVELEARHCGSPLSPAVPLSASTFQ